MLHLSKLKKGMKSEQIAILHLIEKGYFVFKNLYGVGPADLIAINEKGAVEIFDVKTESYRRLTQEQKKLKMKFIFVNKEGECRIARR